MKKIPTLFVRNKVTNLVINEVTPGCEWVLNGEGIATRKYDGTCCMIRDGKLYKRFDGKHGKAVPINFEPCQEPDSVTGHWPGWIPVGNGPEDNWHRCVNIEGLSDGTYELVGPKINGNPEGVIEHQLIPHGKMIYDLPRNYNELKDWLINYCTFEGIVFHSLNGLMCKIKRRDFVQSGPKRK